MSVFGTSWGDYSAQAGTWAMGAGMWDNMIAYETPSFAGFKVFAQYGMGNQVSDEYNVNGVDVEKKWGEENESSSDRYYAIGASYNNGPLSLYFAVDSINYSSESLVSNTTTGATQFGDQDDSLTVTFGGNYDFEVVKLYAGAQYFDEIKTSKMKGVIQDVDKFNSGASVGFADRMKGWSIGVSAGIPAAGGTVMVGAAYLDAEAADSESSEATPDDELTRWIVSAGYDYPFSKRTDVYGVVTYNQDSIDNVGAQDVDPSVWGVMIGLRHRF